MKDERIRPIASFPDLSLAQVNVTQGERLPRWEANGAVYDVALHLADSVPTEQLLAWREKRELIRLALADENSSATARQAMIGELRSVYNERVEKYLTAGFGACLLRRRDVAEAVSEVLKHDDEKYYLLHLYTIMPNHIHVIVGNLGQAGALKDVIERWKRISAHKVNRICGRVGEVWQRDAYTRIIRDREEYVAKLKYAWNNPEAAGLSDGFLRERFV